MLHVLGMGQNLVQRLEHRLPRGRQVGLEFSLVFSYAQDLV